MGVVVGVVLLVAYGGDFVQLQFIGGTASACMVAGWRLEVVVVWRLANIINSNWGRWDGRCMHREWCYSEWSLIEVPLYPHSRVKGYPRGGWTGLKVTSDCILNS